MFRTIILSIAIVVSSFFNAFACEEFGTTNVPSVFEQNAYDVIVNGEELIDTVFFARLEVTTHDILLLTGYVLSDDSGKSFKKIMIYGDDIVIKKTDMSRFSI